MPTIPLPRAFWKRPVSFWKDDCGITWSKTAKFSIRFSTRRRCNLASDALHGDRKVQRRARDLPTARRQRPHDAGRFELHFKLDRSASQNLLANHGDRRFRSARTLDRQL